MILLVGVSFLFCEIFYNGYFLSIEEMRKSLSKANIPLRSDNLLLQLLTLFSLNVILGPFLNIMIFLGEEIGWRVFMMPRLLKLYGNKAYLIGGTIWAIWHAFIIALGHNYPGYPISGNILFIFLCIPVGYLLQYFYIKSESVFIPAIMHGVLNGLTMTVLVFMVDDSKVQPIINTPAGIIGVLVFSCAAIFTYRRSFRTSITNIPN
jgi:membrane protease YdiL (CAAX protease family)